MEMYTLTDKQRKWLESLSDADKHYHDYLIKLTLERGWYSETGQSTFILLVIKYRKKYKLNNVA